MPDLLFVSALAPLLVLSLLHPWSGLLILGWLHVVQPDGHVVTSGQAIPFSLLIAMATALGWAFSRDRKGVALDPTSCLLILLTAAAALSSAFSLMPAVSQPAFGKIMATMAFLLLLRLMVVRQVRVHGYVWLMVFAMAYLGLEDGVRQLTASTETAFADRDRQALSMLLALPLMHYLRLQSRHHWVQTALIGAMAMTVLAAFATLSLTAAIGLLVVSGWFCLQYRRPIFLLMGVPGLALGLFLAPAGEVKEETVLPETEASVGAEEETSKTPPSAWRTYLAAALERPLTGAGPDALETMPVFARFAASGDGIGLAHARPEGAPNLYLQLLGDLGAVAFLIYIALLVVGFRDARRIVRQVRGCPELKWMSHLARVIQLNLVIVALAGTISAVAFDACFLSLLIVLAAVRQKAADGVAPQTQTVGRRRPTAKTQEKAATRPAAEVDMTGIAHIWQKAASVKVTRLAGTRRRRRLMPGGGAAP